MSPVRIPPSLAKTVHRSNVIRPPVRGTNDVHFLLSMFKVNAPNILLRGKNRKPGIFFPGPSSDRARDRNRDQIAAATSVSKNCQKMNFNFDASFDGMNFFWARGSINIALKVFIKSAESFSRCRFAFGTMAHFWNWEWIGLDRVWSDW